MEPIKAVTNGLIDQAGNLDKSVEGSLKKSAGKLIGATGSALLGESLADSASGTANSVTGKADEAQGDFAASALLAGAGAGIMGIAEAVAAAEGGLFSRPTLAMVGEGGQAEAVVSSAHIDESRQFSVEIGVYAASFPNLRLQGPTQHGVRQSEVRAFVMERQRANRKAGRRFSGEGA